MSRGSTFITYTILASSLVPAEGQRDLRHFSKDPKTRAAASRGCTVLELTKHCSYFDPEDPKNPYKDKPDIVLSDGSKIPNFLVRKKLREAKSSHYPRELSDLYAKDLDAVHRQKVKAQEEIMHLLENLPGKKLAEGFIADLTDISSEYSPLNAELAEDETVYLRLPSLAATSSTSSQLKAMTVGEARDLLDKLLGPDRSSGGSVRKKMEENWYKAHQSHVRWDFLKNNRDAWKEAYFLRKEKETDEANAKKKESHVAELYQKVVRPMMVEVITKGKPTNKWNDYERAMVDKLYTVSLALASSRQTQNDEYCQGEIMTPRFHVYDNTITVCSRVNTLPDLNIIDILTHEAFHSIDPCFSQYPSYRLNGAELAKFRVDITTKEMTTFLSEQIAKGVRVSSAPLAVQFNKGNFEEAKRKNWISIVSPAIPPEKYPLRSVAGCLRTEQGGSFADGQSEVGTSTPYKECFGRSSSMMNEALGDWVAAEVTGKFTKTIGRALTGVEKLSPIAYFAAMACYEYLGGIRLEEDSGEKPHPVPFDRCDLITLANTDVQTAEGCSPLLPQPCVLN